MSKPEAAGELAEPYQLGVGEVERLRGDLLQAANLELKGNPYIAHRKKQINALCDAAKAAAMRPPAPSAQEEWRTVPVEPTEAMLTAMGLPHGIVADGSDERAHRYKAVLAAAPSAPAGAVGLSIDRELLYDAIGALEIPAFSDEARKAIAARLRRTDDCTAPPQAGREDSQSVKAWAIVGPDGWIYTESMSDLNARDAWWNFKQSNRQKTGSVESLKQDGYRAEQVTISTASGAAREEG